MALACPVWTLLLGDHLGLFERICACVCRARIPQGPLLLLPLYYHHHLQPGSRTKPLETSTCGQPGNACYPRFSTRLAQRVPYTPGQFRPVTWRACFLIEWKRTFRSE
ncbi:hypothetical protein C8Q79DRAFT_938977 [Trametes meyenii]|nr:hypothetical protein C8Q79DRAFT_938977 [Trametes meyenii]